MPDTGNQSTVTLTGFVGNVHAIKLPKEEISEVATSHLLTDGFETCMPGDLIKPGECQIQFEFDDAEALPAIGVADEELTVTLASGATYIGTGFVKSIEYPELKNNELNMATLVFRFDGETGPEFTPA